VLKLTFSGLLVAIGLSLLVTGCGGSDSESEVLTKSQFIKQADAICANGIKKKDADLKAALTAASAASVDFNNKAAQEKLVKVAALPPLRTISDELNELEPPSGDQDRIDAMRDALDAGLTKAEEKPALTLAAEVHVLDKSNRLAEEYGLEACNQLG
jgi:hypothetical protein